MLAPYKAYMALDSYVVIAAGNDNLFRRFCAAIEHPEWSDDPRFTGNPERVANRKTLNELIDKVIGQQPRDHWVKVLEAAGVPCAPMQTIDEVIAHPQTGALGMLQSSPDGAVNLVALPLSFDGRRPGIRSRAPALGEHTAAVLNNHLAEPEDP